ncbi:pyridoxal phosphate-dependent transferase [Macrophomina phaseolina]|uniref:Pyridoxal phosphate-dependent transferase n=1 Tax=Macrophomina phaseolina TaxID=35725 RepID=A0ABQ8G8E2_9PEZI|nr:pyridoxal phosphate-dependent transferase [Macrophomina phaseolina]
MPPPTLSTRIQDDIEWFNGKFMRHVNKERSAWPAPIDLGTAENWLIRDEVVAMIKDATSDFPTHLLSYAKGLGGPDDFLEATSNFFNNFFHPLVPVKPEHIVSGPGASTLLETLFYCICEKGDGILVEAPFWGSFGVYSTVRNNVSLVPVGVPPSVTDVGKYVSYFEDAVRNSKCRIRGILFCNPQNPQGHLHRRDMTEGLLRFCEEADLHFISDELYALSTFGRVPACHDSGGSGSLKITESPEDTFTSLLQIDLDRLRVDASRVHVIYSISKDLGSSGLRMGLFATQANPELRYCMAILNFNRVSTATFLITTRLLSNTSELKALLDLGRSRLASAASLVVEFLSYHRIPFYRPVAGVYVWAKFGQCGCTWEDERKLASTLATGGVFVGTGEDYSNLEPGWLRLSFAIPRESLTMALHRIEEALEFDTMS